MASKILLIESKKDKGLSNQNPLNPILANKKIYLVNTEIREIQHVNDIDEEQANCDITQHNYLTFGYSSDVF